MNFATKKLILRPSYFIFQWHITERCNWHCRHCYLESDSKKEEVSLKGLIKIFNQYLRLIKCLGKAGADRTRLSITGGEPLLREDFFSLLEHIHKYNKLFSLSILSNASLVNRENARRLKSLGVKVFQVSLEGIEKENDYIRGPGRFNETIGKIKILVDAGIEVGVSLTLTKRNVSDIPPLIKLCNEIGVSRLGLRRLIPIGKGSGLSGILIGARELRKLYLYIERKQEGLLKKGNNLRISRGCEEGIFSQEADRPVNACAVIEGRALVVLPNGDVIPCRRLPVKIGNVFKEGLVKIYYDSIRLKGYRNLNNANRLCKECLYFDRCLSGAKCVSHALFKEFWSPDPQCYRLFNSLDPSRVIKGEPNNAGNKLRICSRLFPGIKNGLS